MTRGLHQTLLPGISLLMLVLTYSNAPAQSDWMIYSSEESQFEATFPNAPMSYTDKRAKNGVTSVSRVLGAGSDKFFCTAGYSEYSPMIGLAAARDDFIDASFATLLESTAVSLTRPPATTLPAVQFIAIADDRRYTAIMAIEGTRVYQVVASSERFGFRAVDIARCLLGFKLTPRS